MQLMKFVIVKGTIFYNNS